MENKIAILENISFKRRFMKQLQILKKNNIYWIMIGLGPIMLLFLLIRIYPIVDTVRYSFYRYHIVNKGEVPFVGLQNYIKLFNDEVFITAFANTVLYTILCVTITLSLALAISILLRSIERHSFIVEVLLYIPVITPWVPALVIWKWIFDPKYGILNYLLSFFGVSNVGWLQDPNVIMYSMVIVSVWKQLGYFVVIYTVGLKNISKEMIEAAEMDGANSIRKITHIILPTLKPIILFTIVMSTIIFMNVFSPVYVLTGDAQGAPATDFKVIVSEIYQNGFAYYQMGYAASEAVVLLLFVIGLILVQFAVFRDKNDEDR
jgi:multiple sugar transport system permease protein